jgi:hypothetical protein
MNRVQRIVFITFQPLEEKVPDLGRRDGCRIRLQNRFGGSLGVILISCSRQKKCSAAFLRRSMETVGSYANRFPKLSICLGSGKLPLPQKTPKSYTKFYFLYTFRS